MTEVFICRTVSRARRHDLLGLLDGDVVADVGAEEELFDFIGDHPDWERVRRERGRTRPDVGVGFEGLPSAKVERDGRRTVALVVEVSPTDLIAILAREAGIDLCGVRQFWAVGFGITPPAALRGVVKDQVIRIDDGVFFLDVRRGVPPPA